MRDTEGKTPLVELDLTHRTGGSFAKIKPAARSKIQKPSPPIPPALHAGRLKGGVHPILKARHR